MPRNQGPSDRGATSTPACREHRQRPPERRSVESGGRPHASTIPNSENARVHGELHIVDRLGKEFIAQFASGTEDLPSQEKEKDQQAGSCTEKGPRQMRILTDTGEKNEAA